MAEAMQTTSWARVALIACPALILLGSASGWLSNSGYSNGWFASLAKPGFMPPGWVFAAVWTTLYALMGLALAFVWASPPNRARAAALRLFFAQLAVNYAWSPIFFGARMIEIGLLTILLMFGLAAATAWRFGRIRPLAGWLLLPYLAWLCLAAALNFEIGRLNPGSDSAPVGIFGE
jgi:translocator protein